MPICDAREAVMRLTGMQFWVSGQSNKVWRRGNLTYKTFARMYLEDGDYHPYSKKECFDAAWAMLLLEYKYIGDVSEELRSDKFSPVNRYKDWIIIHRGEYFEYGSASRLKGTGFWKFIPHSTCQRGS